MFPCYLPIIRVREECSIVVYTARVRVLQWSSINTSINRPFVFVVKQPRYTDNMLYKTANITVTIGMLAGTDIDRATCPRGNLSSTTRSWWSISFCWELRCITCCWSCWCACIICEGLLMYWPPIWTTVTCSSRLPSFAYFCPSDSHSTITLIVLLKQIQRLIPHVVERLADWMKINPSQLLADGLLLNTLNELTVLLAQRLLVLLQLHSHPHYSCPPGGTIGEKKHQRGCPWHYELGSRSLQIIFEWVGTIIEAYYVSWVWGARTDGWSHHQ